MEALEGFRSSFPRHAGGEKCARDSQEPPSSGNRNAPSRIFCLVVDYFCLFGFFFWPFAMCLCPQVCPNLSPTYSESFRILSWLVSYGPH